jgi:peptidoglycan/LPS O-acetylase OafA/YrhL
LTIGWSFAIDPKSVLGVRYWAVDELPLARLPEFLMGIVIAKLLNAGAIPRIPLWFACLLTGVVYLLDPHVPLALRIVAFGVIPFVMLVASAAQTDLAGSPSPFRSRLMVTLGTWSFCFYLVHQLCIRLILAASPHVSGVPDLVWFLASLGFALIAAILLCEFIEKPFERRLRSDHQLPVIVSAT